MAFSEQHNKHVRELGMARTKTGLDEFEVALFNLVGELLVAASLFQRIHQIHRIGAELAGVVIVGDARTLNAKRVETPSMPSPTATNSDSN